ncbi:NAD-dependent epimerase/dehydratase family protein [Litorivicinus lipolyticus]|uniref:NAD-dependent epimerase/dehydratase family protein n=1 Tax=Litorivicinus lipolyticus TaxID=418701 RepID=UPI003B5BEC93
MKVLVTGCAGFIGMHVSRALLARGDQVIGIDNLNDYYDPALKQARLGQLRGFGAFKFVELDIAHDEPLLRLFQTEKPTHVINLAAQAGVRYSIENPGVYVQSNLVGFANILEACRQTKVEQLIYASSSSVYGANAKIPFSTSDRTDQPVSFYAATKKANEAMAHSYSHLYGLKTTGLRYFTVYGSWGRPDMAPWLFTEAILSGETIKVFNNGKCQRDFTHVSDIANGTIGLLDAPFIDPDVNFELHNIGNQSPIELEDFIDTLERKLEVPVIKEYLPAQPGDVARTFADTSSLTARSGYRATMSLDQGITEWIDWFKSGDGRP